MVVPHHGLGTRLLFAKELGGGQSNLDGKMTGHEFTYATSDA
jgi:hypothetical protein